MLNRQRLKNNCQHVPNYNNKTLDRRTRLMILIEFNLYNFTPKNVSITYTRKWQKLLGKLN